VATNWETRKLAEKGRTSVTEGIPAALPALALTAKLQRKALAVGMVLPTLADEAGRVAEGVARLSSAPYDHMTDPTADSANHRITDGEGGAADGAEAVGDLLFSLANVARLLGVDPETALRARAGRFRTTVEAHG
jgi:uncharacterized protein YabN with tetrapyrrole methylase and pyrophosphatase domain